MEDPSVEDASSKGNGSNSRTSTRRQVASVTLEAAAPQEVNEDP